MPLYQNSVLKKYLKQQHKDAVAKAFKKFAKYFHDSKIQENIRSSKEEEYQGIFLTELFSKILGYTMKPNANFDLVAEYKNEKNSKKADGAILKDNQALGVIELKGTNTKDLEKVRQQAFDYKANQTGCVYVITSNFEKIRFYINNAVEFEEFELFTLNQERFELLYLCLAKDNLLNNVPLKIKEASVQEEEAITKKFYKDYSTFKRELFRDLVKLNMKNEVFRTELNNADTDRGTKNIKQALFKKSQKLIDRFLFIFFAEDRGLLPPNSTVKILDQWNKLKELDEHVPLYSRYKKYFNYLDTGRKGTDKTAEIFAYNGGLFQPDGILDSLLISDDLLYKHTKDLQAYDFESQVDVNILGHIFENSLNEIESVNAEIEGTDFDKQKTKRKKDGVFYTPKYITKYIVDNTVGKLCSEKKAELKIVEEDFHPKRQTETKKKLLATIENYRAWLLQLTILDPACGSGAFLNQALDFLIKEHEYIDELQTKLLGGGLVFPNIETTVLENNIYGVDINEESVEIAKLSLWLRTAQPRRKLNDLSSNIKCGNSLIDSKSVAGAKAFKWEEEYPQVFEKGGFDVIIGNPPYVDIKALDNDLVKALFEKYETTENRINLYSIFIEKGYEILKEYGFLSFINPNSILVNSSYTKIRKMLLDDMTTIIKLPDDVFEDATVETIIFEFRKKSCTDEIDIILYKKDEKINFVDDLRKKIISKSNWKQNDNFNFNIYVSPEQFELLQKIPKESIYLGEIADFTLGITPYDKYKGHSPELIKSRGFHSDTKESDEYKPLISGGNIERYFVSDEIKEYIKYGDWLGAPRDEKFFNSPRVLIRQIVSGTPPRIYSGYTEKPLYYTQIGFGIIPRPDTISVKSLLALLNSKLINFYHKYSFLDLEKELFQKILIANCKKFPISTKLFKEPKLFNQIIDKMIELKAQENLLINGFVELLQNKLSIDKPSKKIQNWYSLDFGILLKEMKKLKVRLSLEEEAEWMQYFKSQKLKAAALIADIEQTETEIDQMVYQLYGLTEEEIQIVENS